MFNQYLTDTCRYLTYTSKISLINWSLTDSNRLFNPNQYLPLFNSYPDFKDNLAWIGNNGIEFFNPHWVLLKFWAQMRGLQDKQDSKIDSANASLYFNKTYADWRWYMFRNIRLVIFSWLSVLCVLDDCPIVLL